jgi:hypothetical protein
MWLFLIAAAILPLYFELKSRGGMLLLSLETDFQ